MLTTKPQYERTYSNQYSLINMEPKTGTVISAKKKRYST